MTCECDCQSEKDECRQYIEKTDECTFEVAEEEGNLTLEEVGEKLDLSAERVRQLQERALKKLENLNKKSRKYDLGEYI